MVYIHSRPVLWRILRLANHRLTCVAHGIAVSFQDSDADCREPLIVNDDQITADLAEKRHTYPSGTNVPFCGMTIFFCQMNLAKILTDIIQIAFGLKRTNYSNILKLDAEVENFGKHILPKVLLPDSPSYDKSREPISIIMRCFYLKAILLLHRPFIGRSKENQEFNRSRERAVQAALLIVGNSIHLFTNPNPLLENHFAAYPMLALDLYTYPDQPYPEANRQALIDMRRVYLELCTQFVVMKRLYKILNVLMGKAWEKAGLALPVEVLSPRMGSFSSTQSTPSPTVGNYDNAQKWGPQGVVPTSLQQFLPTDLYSKGNLDWTGAQEPVQGNFMPMGATTSNPFTWDPIQPYAFPLFGSDTSSSQFSDTPQFPEGLDVENNLAWVYSVVSYFDRRIKLNGICL